MPGASGTRRTTPLDSDNPQPEACTPGLRLKLLAKLPFFSSVSPSEIAEIDRFFLDRGFEPGQRIYAAGDPAGRLYVVLAGKVKVTRHTLSGQDVLLDLMAPGEFFGTLSVLGQDAYADTAYAQTGCCLLSIDAADFQVVMERYSSVAIAALRIVQERLTTAHDLIRQLSAEAVECRVAAALLKLAAKMGETRGDSVLIQTPLSRQDLADMVGTTLETASRVISRFRKAGLIDSGRQWIAIMDAEGLRSVAEGSKSLGFDQ